MPLNLHSEKSYYQFYNDMLVRVEPNGEWHHSTPKHAYNHEGDALGKTAQAYFAYYGEESSERLLKACEECFYKWEIEKTTFSFKEWKTFFVARKKYFKWIPSRRNDGADRWYNMSRDHVLIFLAVTKIIHPEICKKYADNIPYRLSYEFTQTPDMWLWIRELQGKFTFPLHLFGIILTSLVYKYLNPKLGYEKGIRPFVLNLATWQLISTKPWFGLRRVARWFLLKAIEKRNVGLRLFLGDKSLTQEEINSVKARTGYQWQRNTWELENFNKVLNETEAEFNTIDIDILKNAKIIGEQIRKGKVAKL